MTCTQFIVGHRGSTDRWDVRDLATNVKLDTDDDFAAGTLTFDLLEVNEGFGPSNGDEVRFGWDNGKTFFGYIFKAGYTSDEVFSITAYDPMRYLKNQDTRVWPIGTLSQRFVTACQSVGIKYKVVTASKYKLPSKLSDGVSFFDMLQEDIEATQTGTGARFILRCNYDTVELVQTPTKALQYLVGDGTGITSWEYDRDIDDAYNVVKVVKTKQDKNGSATATAITSASASGSTISRWGKLQKVEKVTDDDTNLAQMKTKAAHLLRASNVEAKTMKLTVLGSMDYQLGVAFMLQVKSLVEMGLKPVCTVRKCTQNFDPTNWTTDLEVTW
ncbi:XkdQ/YqbQ family protein [Lacticaseibacillus hulanensis]|uniref:XkdQ/YqbQ family protein n=1 Tax=Lacticaseibacillus hulanensis TaxID=2493111 RepID=UPI000FDC488C|nr:hypothetical protein [Lacticaseibacillus hulanensis]